MMFRVNSKKPFSKANIVYVCGQTDVGIDCYYYVEIFPGKMPLFKNIPEGNPVDITRYGAVIYKGYGAPAPEVIEAMKRDYGFDTPPVDVEEVDCEE